MRVSCFRAGFAGVNMLIVHCRHRNFTDMKMALLLHLVIAASGLALSATQSLAAAPIDYETVRAQIPGKFDRYVIDWEGASPKIMELSRSYPTPVGPLINPIAGQGASNAVYTATQFLYACPYLTIAPLDLTQDLVLNEVMLTTERNYPERGTDYMVVFKQQYGGYSVYRGECRVGLNNHYEIWTVDNELQEITCSPQTPKLTAAEAFSNTQASYAAVTTNNTSSGSLFYFSPSNLVWGFYVEPYGQTVMVDSVTGAIVSGPTNHVPIPPTPVMTLNNYDAQHPVYYLDTNTLADAGCYVEMLAGPDAASLQPIVPMFSGSPAMALTEGYFDFGIGVVPDVAPATQAWFQVIAWKGEGTADGWQKAAERVISVAFPHYLGYLVPGHVTSPFMFNFPADLIIRPVLSSAGPALRMSRIGDQVIFSWPVSDGFTLETTDSLAGANWVAVKESPGIVGGENVLTTAITDSVRCFRLRR